MFFDGGGEGSAIQRCRLPEGDIRDHQRAYPSAPFHLVRHLYYQAHSGKVWSEMVRARVKAQLAAREGEGLPPSAQWWGTRLVGAECYAFTIGAVDGSRISLIELDQPVGCAARLPPVVHYWAMNPI